MSKFSKTILAVILTICLCLGSLTAFGWTPSDYTWSFGEPRWQAKYNNLVASVYASLSSLSTLVTNWAPTENILTLVTAAPTYVDADTFTVPGDYTSRFPAAAVVQAQLAEGLVDSTVAGSAFGGGVTTVNLNTAVLTDPITRIFVVATRDGLWPNGPGYVVARDYGVPGQAALDAALAAIGVSERTLVLTPGTWSITADTVIPANVNLVPQRGALLTNAGATTKNLTFLGCPPEAGPYQIFSFSGTGEVAGLIFAYPEWFGAKGDAGYGEISPGVSGYYIGTDDTAAFTQALAATGQSSLVILPNKMYSANVYLHDKIQCFLKGAGINLSTIIPYNSDLPAVKTKNVIIPVIEDMTLAGPGPDGDSGAGYCGLYLDTYSNYAKVNRVYAYNFRKSGSGYGLYNVNTSYDISARDCFFNYNNYGVYLQGSCTGSNFNNCQIYANKLRQVYATTAGPGLTFDGGQITALQTGGVDSIAVEIVNGEGIVFTHLFAEPQVTAGSYLFKFNNCGPVTLDGITTNGNFVTNYSILLAGTNHLAIHNSSLSNYPSGVISGGQAQVISNSIFNSVYINSYQEWFNTAGQARVTTQFDKTNDSTLADIPLNKTVTLLQNRTYKFRAILFCVPNGIAGARVSMSGTCTFDDLKYKVNLNRCDGNGALIGIVTAALQTSFGQPQGEHVSGDESVMFTIEGTISVANGGGGTLVPQFAQDLATSGQTSSVLVGSTFIVEDITGLP